MSYYTLTLSVLVLPEGQPIFSEMATEVRIEDEGAGPFLTVTQRGRKDIGTICLDRGEWPRIRDAVDKMMDVVEELTK